jgi:hypothetical protein
MTILPTTLPVFAASPATSFPVEVGGEYQLNITNTNDGLNDKDRGSQTKTTSLNLKGAKFTLKSKLSDSIDLTVLYKAKEGELERYYVTNKITNNFDLTIGKQKIKTYGLHRKITSGTTTPVLGAYLDQNPLKDKMAIDASYKLAGTFSLQIVEDYSNCKDSDTYAPDPVTSVVSKKTTTACQSWNAGNSTGIVANSKETQTKQKQPAVAFEWLGSFGDFSPLLQFAVYDYGKSNTGSVGIRYKSKIVDAYLDYTADTRNDKGIDPNDPAKFTKLKNTIGGAAAYVEAKVGNYTPFLHLSSLTTKPYKKPGSTDSEMIAAKSNAQGRLDKNEVTAALGTHYDGWGGFYRPFVDITVASGKYVDFKDPTKQKTLSKSDFVVGLIGKF